MRAIVEKTSAPGKSRTCGQRFRKAGPRRGYLPVTIRQLAHEVRSCVSIAGDGISRELRGVGVAADAFAARLTDGGAS